MKKILYTAFYFCSALLLSSCIGDFYIFFFYDYSYS